MKTLAASLTAFAPEMQIFAVDESKVYTPPSKLHLPEAPSTNSDSALSLQEDSDMSSSASSSPSYSNDGGDRQMGREVCLTQLYNSSRTFTNISWHSLVALILICNNGFWFALVV